MLASTQNAIWCKICGITNPQDAQAAEQYGADAVGLNFYPDSPRCISLSAAAEIMHAVACTRVGLFVNPSRQAVEQVLELGGIDLLQFHGDETAAFCRSFALPYMKVVRVQATSNFSKVAASYHDAWALLLDTYVAGRPGGTGQTFDWQLWPRALPMPGILAGGLHADNVAAAIRQLQPFGVDVCGGVEGSSRVRKDHLKIEQFVNAVKGTLT